MQWKQIGKMAVQHMFLPVVYRLYRFGRVHPGRIVFADAHHTGRPANMEPLIEYLQNRPGTEIKELYMDYQKTAFLPLIRGMVEFMRLYAGAEAVVICDNFLPAASCRKRKETTVVQLWHACGALKRFGYDTTDDIPAGYRGNVFKNTDLVTVSAPFCVKPFASAMRLPVSHVQPVGICRTDRYFDKAWREACRERFFCFYPEAEGKKIILWAPTFRGQPGHPECIDMDLQGLRESLGEDCFLIASLHPHMKGDDRFRTEKDCPLTTEELFPVTDVLIADYSSLIYEYLLFDHPLVLYTPDFESYSAKRGFYMKYEEIPGIQVFGEEELPDAVLHAARHPGEMHDRRDTFLKKYMCACDGHSVERVAKRLLRNRRRQ